jgi:nucleoside-diphosphate-sugar epimerase
MACRNANNGDTLLTVAIAPHQVYGPRDMLFLHSMLGAGERLRIFGRGKNKISLCHVDNYCHGLIVAERALYPGSAALGKFYIVTDGEPQLFWPTLDSALTAIGCTSVFRKFRLPSWFILPLAYACELFSKLTGRKLKLNTFAARMLMIHRWFDIEAARRDLDYEPVIKFEQGWADTVEWFRTEWAPVHGPMRHRK